MPSVSKKQHNFMAAVAHNPAFAKKVGIPQSVGKDFNTADKGKTFKQGGDIMAKMNPFMAMIAKKKEAAKGGMHKMPDGKMMKDSAMKKGGMAKDDTAQDKAMIKKAMKQHDMQEHKGGKGTNLKLAKGGMFRKSANGVAKKGLTKAMMPKMSKGGRTC